MNKYILSYNTVRNTLSTRFEPIKHYIGHNNINNIIIDGGTKWFLISITPRDSRLSYINPSSPHSYLLSQFIIECICGQWICLWEPDVILWCIMSCEYICPLSGYIPYISHRMVEEVKIYVFNSASVM